MNIIIPMAGWGSRLRPHTLTIPKPMLPIAGKPIVQRLVGDLIHCADLPVETVGFVIRKDFGAETEQKLLSAAEELGLNAKIYYQDEPLGTAHAILCASELLSGPVIVGFADTLFRTDMKIDTAKDGVIWVQKVEDPSAFGVVKLDGNGVITDFVEKPKEFVSDLAIIGIYYFRDGGLLKREMDYLIENNIREKGEYQLTNALENMKQKGAAFVKGEVSAWLDCGNKDATVDTNQRMLGFLEADLSIPESVLLINSTIVQPCYLSEGVVIENSVVGPYVSVGEQSKISHSVVQNSIIQSHAEVKNKLINNSMIGNRAKIEGKFEDLSIGDYSVTK
jgi:glucose-1-phosphate thymidylyltransferase